MDQDKEYQEAKKIYEELLKEYPQNKRQIENAWKDETRHGTLLEEMKELQGIAEAFF